MKWEVRGALRETGEDLEVEIDAPTETDAVTAAGLQGLLIAAIRQLPEVPSVGSVGPASPTSPNAPVHPPPPDRTEGARPRWRRLLNPRLSWKSGFVVVLLIFAAAVLLARWNGRRFTLDDMHANGFSRQFVATRNTGRWADGTEWVVYNHHTDRNVELVIATRDGSLRWCRLIVPADTFDVTQMANYGIGRFGNPSPAMKQRWQLLDAFVTNLGRHIDYTGHSSTERPRDWLCDTLKQLGEGRPSVHPKRGWGRVITAEHRERVQVWITVAREE